MTDEKTKSEADLRREAYNEATKALREKHQDEFRALVTQAAADRGVTYEFRKTPQERAEEQARELLNQFPELRQSLLGQE